MKHLGKLAAAGTCNAGGSSDERLPPAAKDLKIGVVNLSLCCSYFVGMDEAVKEEAKAFSERHRALDRRRRRRRQAHLQCRGSAQPEGRRTDHQRRLDRGRARSARCHQGGRRARGPRRPHAEGRRVHQLDRTRQLRHRRRHRRLHRQAARRQRAAGCAARRPGRQFDRSRPHQRRAVGRRKVGHQGREGAGFRRLERRRRLQADGGHADQVPRHQRGVLRERFDVPGRPEGDQGCRA